MVSEGLGYDLGSMSFWVLLAFGVTIGFGTWIVKSRQKEKANKQSINK